MSENDRLLQLATELEEVVAYANNRQYNPAPNGSSAWLGGLRSDVATETPRDVAGRFVALFADELEQVRRARNSVAYRQAISPENVENAARLAERLLSIIRPSAGGSQAEN